MHTVISIYEKSKLIKVIKLISSSDKNGYCVLIRVIILLLTLSEYA